MQLRKSPVKAFETGARKPQILKSKLLKLQLKLLKRQRKAKNNAANHLGRIIILQSLYEYDAEVWQAMPQPTSMLLSQKISNHTLKPLVILILLSIPPRVFRNIKKNRSRITSISTRMATCIAAAIERNILRSSGFMSLKLKLCHQKLLSMNPLS